MITSHLRFFQMLVIALVTTQSALSIPAKEVHDAATNPSNSQLSIPYNCGEYFSPRNVSKMLDKNGIVAEHFRWPKGVVPYTLQPDITDEDREVIKAGIELITDKTCLKYVERTNELNYLTIVTVNAVPGCHAVGVGMRSGPQLVNFGAGCMHAILVAHELLHATGFWHEHARADRDEYIKVDFDNIIESKHDQFALCTEEEDACSSFDTPYNVMSVMHYPGMGSSFAKDKTKPIMIARSEKGVPKIPDSQLDYPGLTQNDVDRIHRMYNNCQ